MVLRSGLFKEMEKRMKKVREERLKTKGKNKQGVEGFRELKRLQSSTNITTRGNEVRRKGGSWERLNHVWSTHFLKILRA